MSKTLLGSLMHGKRRSGGLEDMGVRLEARIGKIPFSGRYHREPRRIQDDYLMSQDVLGSGYNGEVKLATSLAKPGQKCAVKSLQLSGVFGSSSKKEQLQSEVENYLTMDHPHITRLYDVYESKHELHMVMECMEGGELFDRVTEKKRFSETEAKDALRQMLLALNYIHSHGIVHRDVKLENFIYDKKKNGHLKLIDFGFSKMVDPGSKVKGSLGTLSYVAPEVLSQTYTTQCDMWSLGVIAFILLGGYMPFSGPEREQIKNIMAGKYNIRPEKWTNVSADARDFIASLLEVDPDKRLTAQRALEHPWLAQCREDDVCKTGEMQPCCEALRRYSQTTKFRRCCLEMLAWSLPNEDRDKVRECFLRMDENQQGTITLEELKHIMVDKLKFVDEVELLKIFEALDYNHDQEIHYSDFLAAMVNSQIHLNNDVLSDAFRRFDIDHSGYITAENLREVLGRKVEGERVEAFIAEADQTHDGKICFEEFASYLRGTRLEAIDGLEPGPIAQEGVPNRTLSSATRKSRRSSIAQSWRDFKSHFHSFTHITA